MDATQIATFVEAMIGFTPIGVADEQSVEKPTSPEVRIFVLARLGALTPMDGLSLVYGNPPSDKAKAFAALLREVADGIDPPPEAA